MTIDELIAALQKIKSEHGGDLLVMTSSDDENIEETLCDIGMFYCEAEEEAPEYLYIGAY